MDKLPADVTLEPPALISEHDEEVMLGADFCMITAVTGIYLLYQVEGGRDPRAHWDEIDAQVDGLKTRAD